MIVQRKWMYLEGIFVGGDIRSQLPEEAKRFDQIDKTFKKVKTMLLFVNVLHTDTCIAINNQIGNKHSQTCNDNNEKQDKSNI